MRGNIPDLSPSDPQRQRKIDLVCAHMSVNQVKQPLTEADRSGRTPSEFAAELDLTGEEGAGASYGWYFRGLREEPLKPSRTLMMDAGVPEAIASVSERYEAPPGVNALLAELGGGSPRSSWLARTPVASVAAGMLCGFVSGARFIGVAPFLMDADGRSHYGPEGSSRMFSDLSAPPLLVLDGMDAAGWSKSTAHKLATVVEDRHSRGLPIVYTAPFSVRDFEAHVSREAGADAGRAIATAVARSLGRNSDERRAHMIPC